MKRRETITLLIWLAFCLFVCIEAWRLGLGSFKMPGPGFIPFGASLCTGLIALALLLLGKTKRTVQEVVPFFQRDRIVKVLKMVCLLAIYPVFLSQLGFFLCTLLFVGLTLRMIEPQRWRAVLGISIGAAVVCYLLFEVLLRIQLPKGILLRGVF
jgi:putative tricarboxylic transport membrane protein